MLGRTLALIAGLALGEPPQASPPVRIALVMPDDEAERMDRLLDEYLADLEPEIDLQTLETFDLASVVMPSEAPTPASARVWIQVSEQRASIFIVDAEWSRVYVRHVPLETGFDELAREQIAVIVEANLESLLAGGTIGIQLHDAADLLGVEVPEPEPITKPEVVEPEPVEPEPVAPEPERVRSIDGMIGLGPIVQVWSAEVAPQYGLRTHGRLIIHAPRPSRRDVLLGVGIAYFVPVRARGSDVDLVMQTLAPRTSWGIRWWATRRVGLTARFEFGFDAQHERPIAVGPTAVADPASWHVYPAFGLGLGVDIRAGGFVFAVGPTLGINPVAVRYRIVDTGEVVLQPWVFRPGLVIEFGWESRVR